MIGKIKVSTPNPPCAYCGGMGGYHSDDLCPGRNPAPPETFSRKLDLTAGPFKGSKKSLPVARRGGKNA